MSHLPSLHLPSQRSPRSPAQDAHLSNVFDQPRQSRHQRAVMMMLQVLRIRKCWVIYRRWGESMIIYGENLWLKHVKTGKITSFGGFHVFFWYDGWGIHGLTFWLTLLAWTAFYINHSVENGIWSQMTRILFREVETINHSENCWTSPSYPWKLLSFSGNPHDRLTFSENPRLFGAFHGSHPGGGEDGRH